MFNSTSLNSASLPASHIYFENAVGRLLAHPAGHYVVVEYYQGPRQPSDLQAFLMHAGQLLARWGWDKLLGSHGLMAAFTQEETEWITTCWRTKSFQHADMLYGALLLPHEVFASLSWRGSQSVLLPAESGIRTYLM